MIMIRDLNELCYSCFMMMNPSILKGEVARYKRKCKESAAESAQLRKKLDDMQTAEIKALQVSWTFWMFDQVVPDI